MWIRSQDKETLTNVTHLEIMRVDDHYVIFTDNHLTPYNKCRLGTYKTKEKAIEILDKITTYIECQHKEHSYYIGKVFQMPKDIIEVKPHEIGERPWLDPE